MRGRREGGGGTWVGGGGRRDKRREGAGEGNEVTGGRHLSRRASTSVPRLSPGFSRERNLGGGAVAVRAAPAAEAARWGPDPAASSWPEKGFRAPERSERVRRGSSSAVQPSPHGVPPFPPLHPILSTELWIRTLQSPPLLGLVPCKLQDRRVPARKSKRSMRESITDNTAPWKSEGERPASPAQTCRGPERFRLLLSAFSEERGG